MMMKSKSISFKQQGFTLLEALIALVVFSIIILGSGTVLSRMLHTQKDIHVQSIIINQMQARLQGAVVNNTPTSGLCGAINKDSILIDGHTYYVGCGIEQIVKNGIVTEWPVLAISSTSQESSDRCADGTNITTDCYIVGK